MPGMAGGVLQVTSGGSGQSIAVIEPYEDSAAGALLGGDSCGALCRAH